MADEEIQSIKKRVIDSQVDSPPKKPKKKTKEKEEEPQVTKTKPSKVFSTFYFFHVKVKPIIGGSDTDELPANEIAKLKSPGT